MGKVRKIVFAITAVSFFLICALSTNHILHHRVTPILMYHSINDNINDNVTLPPESFERQMKYLYQHGYKVISLDKLSDLIETGGPIPSKSVVITFDRSSEDIYTIVYPILKKYGFTATVFLMPSVIGYEGSLTWSQIREMDENGISLGSHTFNHPWLPDLSFEEAKYEIYDSKVAIERQLTHEITLFAYPFGAFDEKIRRLVKKSGYRAACTTALGRSYPDEDTLVLKRVYVHRGASDNVLMFKLQTSGYYVAIREGLLRLLRINAPRKPTFVEGIGDVGVGDVPLCDTPLHVASQAHLVLRYFRDS